MKRWNHQENQKRKQIEYDTLTSWFMGLTEKDLPVPPFQLKPGVRVMGTLFYDRIREEIARGIGSSRAFTGALQDDLVYLKLFIGEADVQEVETWASQP